MLFTESIMNTIEGHCKGKEHVKLTVGILKDGKEEIKLFGQDGEEQFYKYYYEIGSITKTFTGMLLAKAIEEKKVNLDDSISKYIHELDDQRYYPTLRRLVTHTSGCPIDFEDYENYELYPENQSSNPYSSTDRFKLIKQFKEITFEDREYPFEYSNLGCSIVGYVLEKIYDREFDDLLRELLTDLELNDTYTSDPIINLSGYNNKNIQCGNWIWNNSSAYCPAGYMYSNIFDMLTYAKKQMNKELSFIQSTHESISTIQNQPKVEVGIFWIKIPDMNIIWHNGGTGCFNTIICIDLQRKNAIVALSNYLDEIGLQGMISLLNKL